ncbi:MAG TPA: rhamnulokinase family protein [Gaiellaceae bacterium]|nr:rhamnulokinase family protein [Gaiellaceae bacterium]
MAAVDLGAQSGRVAVGQLDSGRLTVDEVLRFDNVPIEVEGVLQWDIDRLFGDAIDGLRAATRDVPVDSVAVDSWAIDFGLVNGDGRVIRGPVHYRDTRRAAAVDSVYSRIPPRELYDRTGIQLMPINTVFELAAMAQENDPALEEAETLLLIPDLLHLRLCGSRSSEFTNVTTTQCFDPRARDWARDLLERLEIPADLVPEVVAPGTVLGRTDDGALVVAVATHDTGSAVAAVPFRRAGSVFLSIGTWSLVGMEIDHPLITDETFAANLTNEGGVGGTFRLLRNVTGLWLLHESRRTWASQGHEFSFEELTSLAQTAPPLRSLVDPDDDSFASPGDMPARIADFCRRTGQAEPEGPGALSRCFLESIALKHATTVDLLREATGTEPAELHVVGGGARNELLCRWTAEATGLPVLAGPEEATLVGNLLVQAMAMGELGSLREARDVVRASFVPTVYEPSASSEWIEARKRFAELVSRSPLEVGS